MRRLTLTGTVLLWLACPALEAADATQTPHDRHCLACHGTQIYTRANRTAKDYAGLRAQVDFWQKNMSLNWSRTEIDAVTSYLAQTYY
jgi:hypothetical protein